VKGFAELVTLKDGTQVTKKGQHLHWLLDEANNCLWAAGITGTAVYISQAPEFADHDDDVIIIVVRGGDEVAKSRVAMTAIVDMIR